MAAKRRDTSDKLKNAYLSALKTNSSKKNDDEEEEEDEYLPGVGILPGNAPTTTVPAGYDSKYLPGVGKLPSSWGSGFPPPIGKENSPKAGEIEPMPKGTVPTLPPYEPTGDEKRFLQLGNKSGELTPYSTSYGPLITVWDGKQLILRSSNKGEKPLAVYSKKEVDSLFGPGRPAGAPNFNEFRQIVQAIGRWQYQYRNRLLPYPDYNYQYTNVVRLAGTPWEAKLPKDAWKDSYLLSQVKKYGIYAPKGLAISDLVEIDIIGNPNWRKVLDIYNIKVPGLTK